MSTTNSENLNLHNSERCNSFRGRRRVGFRRFGLRGGRPAPQSCYRSITDQPASQQPITEQQSPVAPPPSVTSQRSVQRKRRRFGNRRGKRRRLSQSAREKLIIQPSTSCSTLDPDKPSGEVILDVNITNGDEPVAADPISTVQQLPAVVAQSISKKHKRPRRAPKRKWKPYFKMTNDERRLLEIREEKRAERSRAQRFKSGQPVAPYNTTQFLFNDLQARGGGGSLADEPVVDVDRIVDEIRHHKRSEGNDHDSFSHSYNRANLPGTSGLNEDQSSVDSYDSSTFDDFNEKEFDMEYDSACVERLSSLSKNDLIKDYLSLEKEYERCRSECTSKEQLIFDLKRKLAAFGGKAVPESSRALITENGHLVDKIGLSTPVSQLIDVSESF